MKKIGILCHVSSLWSEYGIGDFGLPSKKFIDFLADNDFDIWQILPINKTNEYNCPYGSICYFSLDEMFVSPDDLLYKNLIIDQDLFALKKLKKSKKVNYDIVKKEKLILLDKAYHNISQGFLQKLEEFIQQNPHITDYAVFMTLLEKFGEKDWRRLPKPMWDKTSNEYLEFIKQNKQEIEKQQFIQYILHSQWQQTMEYAKARGIQIVGDVPIYPDKNSFDVFADKDLYKLGQDYYPEVTGGVPPDCFSEDGQNWGTCIYDWEKLEQQNFEYMTTKISRMLKNNNVLRLDHFAGYAEHYEVNNIDKSKSEWVKGGGEKLFDAIAQKCGLENIVVEDLGIIKPECAKVKEKYDLMGMCVLEDCFDNKHYRPSFVESNNIYYIGTHDNNTLIGFLEQLGSDKKSVFCELVGVENKSNKNILKNTIKNMLKSNAKVVVLQMQDILMQDGKYRMNLPGQAENWWEYRTPKNYVNKSKKILKIIKESKQNG